MLQLEWNGRMLYWIMRRPPKPKIRVRILPRPLNVGKSSKNWAMSKKADFLVGMIRWLVAILNRQTRA